jgi:hypothetical protein
MKKILTLICTLLCANVLLAQVGTEISDPYSHLRYSITSMNPPEVKIIGTFNHRIYEIPSQITYNGQIYTVTAIGQNGLSREYPDGVIESPFIIPNSITSIEAGAFSGQRFLTYITIPNSVTSIGGGVFSGCARLTSVTLSNNITSLPSYYRYGTEYGFFEGCDSLTSITIPNSVTSIGNNAFRNCSSLTSVTCLTETAPTIGSNVFEYTPDTKTLIVACGLDYSSWEDSTTWANIQYTDLDIFRIGNLRYEKISNTEVKIIDCNDSVTEIIIPLSVEQCGIIYNVTSIGSGAFANCSFLQNITCLATTPPTLADNTVFPYPNIATLTVPCGTLEAYSSATSFWNMFFMGRISEDGYDVVATANDNAFGSVAVESDCSTAMLTATANEGYVFLSWNDGNTENPRVVSLTSDTSFVANFALIDESSLLEAEAESISFFPNPTKSEITFSQAIEKVEVIDLTGKVILTFSNAKTINIESLPSGAYYLRLTNEEKTTMKKVIKQ